MVVALTADPPATLFSAGTMFVATWAVCALVASTLGLVWHTIALDRGWTSAVSYLVAGSLLGGFIPGALWVGVSIFALFHPGEEFTSEDELLAIIVGSLILGGLNALVFWLIRRPDRDASPNPPTSPP